MQFLKGVGPNRAKLFAKLKIETVQDLIAHFPFRHQIQGAPQPINTLTAGESATVIGHIVDAKLTGRRWKESVLALIEDETGECEIRWFNAAYMIDRLATMRRKPVRVHGRVRNADGVAQLVNPRIEVAEDVPWSGASGTVGRADTGKPSGLRPPGLPMPPPAVEATQKPEAGGQKQTPDRPPRAAHGPAAEEERLEPVYRSVEKLPSRVIAGVVQQALPQALREVEELFDDAYLSARTLARRRSAIERMHRPRSLDDVPIARRRIAYDELFLMQLAIAMKRNHTLTVDRAIALPSSDAIDARIRRRFPFTMTSAQGRAVREIAADLARPRPMNRMLQGDVGSGKTVVALYAALVAIANRQQCAIMAPTEVLAEQHFRNVEKYLEGSQVRRVLLTGRTTAKQRATALEAISAGEMDLVIGTQALLEKDVTFRSLALVIVDEQHKFGVAQRGTIRSRGAANVLPHYLVMSATPIPRTLSMTVFGDLDVSILDELPPGRQPTTTLWAGPKGYADVWAMVKERLSVGEQAFVVYPLVEESAAMPLRAATCEVEHIAKKVLPEATVDLLHGKMPGNKKQAVMERFARGETQVLVCTTVIEVGVDVPNATVMVIQHADRYGLAALHQLRGRVGRGDRPAVCALLADKAGPLAQRRLGILCATTDGFRIAEEDLRLRGPGEILGTQQHGWPELRVANLIDDADLLDMAQRDALALVRKDPRLAAPANVALRRELIARFRHRLAWIDVA